MSVEWVKHNHYIRDIIHDSIAYNGIEEAVMENAIFTRLHRIYQSSLAYMTFPSNKVHRFEHSVGVMHLAGEFFYNAICNSNDEEQKKLLDEVEKEIEAWIESKDSNCFLKASVISDAKDKLRMKKGLWIESTNSVCMDCLLYKYHLPSSLIETAEQRSCYYIAFEAVRLVGLLHDVGHLPYSHLTEAALKSLYEEVKDNSDYSGNNVDAFKKIIGDFCPDNKKPKHDIHEEIGIQLTNHIFMSIIENYDYSGLSYVDQFFIGAVFFMTEKILESGAGEFTLYSDLHSIVDGIVDCDRMDYSCRDLFCSGISKELPQYDRILQSVQLYYEPSPVNDTEREERFYFAFTTKAIEQIEALLTRRWNDFAIINYHHSVHRQELLLNLVIKELGEKALKEDLDEIGENMSLVTNISSLWKVIGEIQGLGEVGNVVSQLDDEWLNLILRKEYFNLAPTRESQDKNRNNPLWNRLDELITGRRRYVSLFKRSGGFKHFDDELGKLYGDEYKHFIEAGGVNSSGGGEKTGRNSIVPPKHYFFQYYLVELGKQYSGFSEKFYKQLNVDFSEWKKNWNDVTDCILEDTSGCKVGFKGNDLEEIFILSSMDNMDPVRLPERSSIKSVLELQQSLIPSFHVYVLPHYDETNRVYSEINRNEMYKKCAEVVKSSIEKVKIMYKENDEEVL